MCNKLELIYSSFFSTIGSVLYLASAKNPRLGRQDFCFSARILARFVAGSRRDFGRWDFCFPARILARFAAGSWRDFGRRDFCFPARILARFEERSRRDFGRREFHFPARILPGSWRDSRREEKSRRPKSRRDPGGIPVEISAGSRQDPVLILQGPPLSLSLSTVHYTSTVNISPFS